MDVALTYKLSGFHRQDSLEGIVLVTGSKRLG
jgi:hypothetical protein